VDISEACHDRSETIDESPINKIRTHRILDITRPIFLFSNHLEIGTKSMASKAAIASGIRNSLEKYMPLITRKINKSTDMLFVSEVEAVNIGIRY
jgi:hypothetical protein